MPYSQHVWFPDYKLRMWSPKLTQNDVFLDPPKLGFWGPSQHFRATD